MLFSADVVPGLDTAAVEEQVIAQDVTSEVQAEREAASETVEQTSEETRSELVLVNENVTDYEQLIADLNSSDDHRIIEVVVLESDRDGIEQVSKILAERSDLAAVHVITHGADGQISLGDSWLNSTTLEQNNDAVAGWGSALAETGDILFYGCNVATDDDGQSLLDDIAGLTGAEVAASNDLTGSAALGGDWELEYVSGAIETEISVRSNSQEGWSHLLAAPTLWDYHHTIDLAASTGVADYPVKLELTEGANGFNHANTQANGDDIRFYDSAGSELSYWIEDWNPGGTSTVWVKVATAGTSSIDMFYGNAGVAAASDAGATFLLYDDFADGTLVSLPAGWTPVAGATTGTQPSVQDHAGNLVFSDGANIGGPVVSAGNWADIVVSHDFRTINASDPIDHAGLIARYQDNNNMVYGGIINKDVAQIWYRNAGTWTQVGGDWSITGLAVDDANWHSQELRLFGDTVELYIDDTFIGSASLATTGAPASGQTGFWSQYSNYEGYRDNQIVRSYGAGKGDIASAVAAEGFNLDENSANGTVVGHVLATDPEGDTLTYSITAGNTGSAFAIDNNGRISVNNSVVLDFETNPTFTLTVEVDDGNGGTDTDTVTVSLNDVNDDPAARSDRVGLSFDGVDDYVQIGADPSLEMTDNLTLEAWIKPTLGGSGSQIIINREGEYELALEGDTGEIKWGFNNADPDWSWHNTGFFAPANQWTHIAVSYDSGVIKTYANGDLIDTYNGSGSIDDLAPWPDLDDLRIGGRQNPFAEYFQGSMSEVRVWNVTRSQAEIQAAMDQPLTGAEAGLVGNWRFDEGSNTAVQDQSPLGNDGVLGNGVTDAQPVWSGLVTDEDTALIISEVTHLLANDSDPDGDALSITGFTQPANGTVVDNGNGTWTYTPDLNFNGNDSLTYTISDGNGGTDTATITITVNSVTDPDAGDTHVYTITAGNTGGAFAIDNGGNITVANNTALDFETTPVFTLTVQVQDQAGTGLTDTATITVNLNNLNEAPITSGIANVTVGEDAPNTIIDLFAAFADSEDADTSLTYTITANTNPGPFAANLIDGVAGILTLDYAPNANGTASITIRATDTSALGVESTFTVTVNPVNDNGPGDNSNPNPILPPLEDPETDEDEESDVESPTYEAPLAEDEPLLLVEEYQAPEDSGDADDSIICYGPGLWSRA